MTETAAPELSRPVALDRIGPGGLDLAVASTEAERAAVAARLGIEAVTALSCRFRLRREPGGREAGGREAGGREAGDGLVVTAEGDLSASVVQVCVVTLEPFEALLRERFRVRFVPEGQESEEDDPESDDEIPFAGGTIDLGEAAVEQLALSLDPFPRRPDAVLPDVAEEAAPHPFAALAARRKPD